MLGKVERAQVLEILNQETILKSKINLGIWSFSPVYEFVRVLSIIFIFLVKYENFYQVEILY